MTTRIALVLSVAAAGLCAGTAAACPGCRTAAAEEASASAATPGKPAGRGEVANFVIAASALVPLAAGGVLARAFRAAAFTA